MHLHPLCRFSPGNEVGVRFEPGNAARTTHGAYSKLALSEPAAETANELRPHLVIYDPADEPALQTFAFVLEQLRAAAAVLEEPGERENRLRLSQDARGWANTALKFSEQFGLTPRSRVALGLDLVRGQAASLTLTRLAQMADEEATA